MQRAVATLRSLAARFSSALFLSSITSDRRKYLPYIFVIKFYYIIHRVSIDDHIYL